MAKGMLSADARNPRMGLFDTVCEDPVYWCRLHEVWMSEEDVVRKGCKSVYTLDMIETRRCQCLERKDFQEWYNRVMTRKKKR